jgi:hypothetical protein
MSGGSVFLHNSNCFLVQHEVNISAKFFQIKNAKKYFERNDFYQPFGWAFLCMFFNFSIVLWVYT